MTVKIEVEMSQVRYEQAQKIAADSHMTVDELLALWVELGREVLANKELTVQCLEAVLKTEVELLDDDCPPREMLGRLWAALGKQRQA